MSRRITRPTEQRCKQNGGKQRWKKNVADKRATDLRCEFLPELFELVQQLCEALLVFLRVLHDLRGIS